MKKMNLSLLFSFLWFIFGSSISAAHTETSKIIEKTFSHDNTYCTLNGLQIEIELRSSSKYTEPKDSFFGEYIFFIKGKKHHLINLNQDKIGNYSLLKKKSKHCSKSFSFLFDQDTLGILFLKNNRPFKEKLAILLFDFKKMSPKKLIETDYLTETAVPINQGFAFPNYPERMDVEMGTVIIQGEKYLFQDRHLHPWINYQNNLFSTNHELTYDKFEWKSFFPEASSFFTEAGWNEGLKNFTRPYYYIAVGQALKKRCLLFVEKKTRITGSENWKCISST